MNLWSYILFQSNSTIDIWAVGRIEVYKPGFHKEREYKIAINSKDWNALRVFIRELKTSRRFGLIELLAEFEEKTGRRLGFKSE
jgi:hypothetical protein